MGSGVPDQTLIEKWRLRHGLPNAVERWAVSTESGASALAFNAIAQDPLVLHRASRSQANRMAAQAEGVALSLVNPQVGDSDTRNAVALFVRRSIDAWRRSLKSSARPTGSVGSSSTPKTVRPRSSNPWEVARRNFPHVDDDTGRLATRMVHDSGSALLSRVRKPWDQVIALAVLRYAARLLRGEVLECESDGGSYSIVADILTVQSYAEENELSPMLVGYCGTGRAADQAFSLLHDARTLRDAVCAAETEERASTWQRAVDFHAYSVIALDHRILLNLPVDDAYEIATAAIRQAEAAMRAPDVMVMPLLPPNRSSSPDVVRLHARACLPRNDRSDRVP